MNNGSSFFILLKDHLLNIFDKIDIFVSAIFFLLGLGIVIISYVKDIGQYGMGFAFLFAAVLYVMYKKKFIDFLYQESVQSNPSETNNNRILFVVNIVFFAGIILSVFILDTLEYLRPFLLYIIIALLFTILIIEILVCRITALMQVFFLAKVFFLSLILRASRVFPYPTIPGSDTQTHLSIVTIIQQIGFMPDYTIAEKYTFTPFWHYFEALNEIVLNTDPKITLFLSNSFFLLFIMCLFIYLIVREISNEKTALISVLLLNIADMVFVLTTTNINPGVIVLLIVPMVVFFLLKISEKKLIIFIFFVYFFICISIITHQLTTFIFFIVILTAFGNYHLIKTFHPFELKSISRNKKYMISAGIVIFFTIVLIFYWQIMGISDQSASTDSSFFGRAVERIDRTIENMINSYVSDESPKGSAYEQLFSKNNVISNVLFSLGSNILLFFGILGILFSLNSESRDELKLFLATIIGILFFIIYPGTYIGLNQVLIPHRFLPFLELFVVIFAAMAIVWIFNLLSSNSQKMVISIIFFLLVFFLITTPYINQNDPLYCKDITYRNDLKNSEVQSIEWLQSVTKENTAVIDDLMSKSKLGTIPGYSINDQEVYYYQDIKSKSSIADSPIIIRSEVMNMGIVRRSGTFGKSQTFDYSALFRTKIKNSDKIYESTNLQIFR